MMNAKVVQDVTFPASGRRVHIVVYDRCKYDVDSNECGDAQIDGAKGFKVLVIPEEEILKKFDCVDEFNEYLVITMKDGSESTYRNSRCDLFIW